ncbi:spore germination protein [Lentibacillus sp. N15]|uniref:spore germination protein n=1 Tax=Lentibacillus songyuanensis TaxID=3136161 RepID=UPI0031BA8719
MKNTKKHKRNKDQPKKAFHHPELFSTKVDENEAHLKKIFGSSKDIIFSSFPIHFHDQDDIKALLVAVDGLTDEDAIRDNVLKPLMNRPINRPGEDLKRLKEEISVQTIETAADVEKSIYLILKGHVLLLVDGYSHGLLLDLPAYENRSVEEPKAEQVVKGAHAGFIESSTTNIALLRRRIPHPALQFESVKIGAYSKTEITIGYVKDIADPNLVKRVKQRLHKIKLDAINSSGEIEQLIEDHPFAIFPTIGNTERPDSAASLLMEGRVIILADGDPVSLYVPLLFLENMKNIEDYISRPYYSSFIRLLRFLAFFVSIILPATYIAVVNFHKVMIPTDLIVPLIQERETVPFPLSVEILIMILMFEVVREAGIRLPVQIGSALSIVGALILGEVSVTAGLVGAPTIVVVSLSYIATFVITPIADVTALLRIGLFIASSMFGAYGLFMALLGLLTHMVSLTSLGVPYMAPFGPFYFRDIKDTFIRLPLRWQKQRPKSIPTKKTTKITSLPKTGDK